MAAAAPTWTVRWYPAHPVNGAPILFRVKTFRKMQSLGGVWDGHDVAFSHDSENNSWYALAGVSLKTHPGSYPLVLSGKTPGGASVSLSRNILVTRARYRTVSLQVPTKFIEPDAAQLQLIEKADELKKKAFLQTSSEQAWSTRFQPPVKAAVSDNFGTERTFNGKVQSIHQGLDYRVPEGTAVRAVNDGTVILAQPLYYEGNCVVIDHGQRLLSIYMHLSQISVAEGSHVLRGQSVGLSGATGRATGAHLHVAVRWQGIYLDPGILFSLPLPPA
ncbi:MAG TPA: M23 family metallopeptidase [Terriglobales bacterium]|nr:M23 family metallopeptidase [Terriglobales bacterium]